MVERAPPFPAPMVASAQSSLFGVADSAYAITYVAFLPPSPQEWQTVWIFWPGLVKSASVAAATITCARAAAATTNTIDSLFGTTAPTCLAPRAVGRSIFSANGRPIPPSARQPECAKTAASTEAHDRGPITESGVSANSAAFVLDVFARPHLEDGLHTKRRRCWNIRVIHALASSRTSNVRGNCNGKSLHTTTILI